MPIRPTKPTACVSATPRSRAAADRCAKGMNIAGAPSTHMAYSHRNERLRKAWDSGVPGTLPSARRAAAGAR